jgi:predicted nucleic acid-binding Zn ribbon protein
MRKRSSTKSLGQAVQDLVSSLGLDRRLQEYKAVTNWAEIVGDHIAKVSSPVRISKGVLVVSVRLSTWRNELTLRKKEIIGKLNAVIGEGTVKDIRFQ